MPSATSSIRHTIESKSKVITLVVFAVDVIVLIVVLSVLWAMPEPQMPGEECGYMCLQCTTDASGMCCGCRDKMLQNFIQKVVINLTYFLI